MKTIVYILIAVFISSILVSATPKLNSNQQQIVKIQSVDKKSTLELLNVSSSIIKQRLEDYGLQNFEIFVNQKQNSIEITFLNNVNVDEILPLIISKGKLEFYETYDRLDVIKLLEKNDKLFSLLNVSQDSQKFDNSSAILGFCKKQDISKVDLYNTKHYMSKPLQGINFMWSEFSDNDGNYFLYLLKSKVAMDKSYLLKSDVNNDKKNDSPEFMIDFNKDGTPLWQDLTKRNIDKSLAIVLDGKVYFAPKVRMEMKNGKCVVTGNFSIKELYRLKSMINNDKLPLDFKLIK